MFWMTSDMKPTLMTVSAAAVGGLQTMVLREYAEKGVGPIPAQIPVPFLPSQLKRASVFGGVVGAAAFALGMYGKMKGRFVTNPLYQDMLMAYGLTAAVTGVVSYFLPASQQVVIASSPAAAVAAAQGFAVVPQDAVTASWVMRQLDEGIL